MSTSYEIYVPRFSPKGFLGMGKEMMVSSHGKYVRGEDYDREVMKNKQLSSSLDAVRLRERQVDGRSKALEKELKDSESANLDLVRKISELRQQLADNGEALAGFVAVADEIAKTVKGKKGKSLQDKYLEARGNLS